MNKCDCYHTQTKRRYTYNPITGDPIGHDVEVGVCWGTKECEECSCGGNEIKCDFYPEVREKALKEQEPKFGEWISVKDRLPTESDGTVLVCFPDIFPYNSKEPFVNAKHNKRVQIATYSQYSKIWYIGSFSGVGGTEPTHWQPLPKPPKGE